jgi:hypothetical protein
LTERLSHVFIYVAMTSTAGRPRGVFVTIAVDGTEYESDDGMWWSHSGDEPLVSVVAFDAAEIRRDDLE